VIFSFDIYIYLSHSDLQLSEKKKKKKKKIKSCAEEYIYKLFIQKKNKNYVINITL